jgi:phosphoheptose isomerase
VSARSAECHHSAVCVTYFWTSPKDQSRERGQRAPEEPAYYEKIADAVALGGKIVVVGHGAGKSNAAHHLTEYLQSHHRETYQRIVRETVADLSSITTAQLLDVAREALIS